MLLILVFRTFFYYIRIKNDNCCFFILITVTVCCRNDYCEWLLDSGAAGQSILLYSEAMSLLCSHNDTINIYDGKFSSVIVSYTPHRRKQTVAQWLACQTRNLPGVINNTRHVKGSCCILDQEHLP